MYLTAKRSQQLYQFNNGGEGLKVCARGKVHRQSFGTLGGDGQMHIGGRERVTRTFVIARHVQLEAAHHFITMQRGPNVLKMQQQPQLKTGH